MTTDRLERAAAWAVLIFVGLLCFATVMEWDWFLDHTGGIFTAHVELSPMSIILLMWIGAQIADRWRRWKAREQSRKGTSNV